MSLKTIMIKNIGIIGGSGKIGTTFKKAFENIGLNVLVSDHNTKDQENDLINKSEWIILCVPIDKTLEVFNSIKNKIRKDQVFSDFTSVKSILGNNQQTIQTIREKLVHNAVKGMLPHNRLGRSIISHLKVYTGSEHPHSAQQPQILEL